MSAVFRNNAYVGATPHQVLSAVWGYPGFRPCQEDIVNAVLAGNDVLGILPTGGGKSLTFQVPGLILPGITLVVSPLVSLMKDQVDNLRDRNIRAVYLGQTLTSREITLAYDHVRNGKAKFVYVAPERLGTERFQAELRQWDVSLLVVDEAHCISQWGYDFRPSYLRIADIRKDLPGVPVVALTASATPRVRDDIRQQLLFADSAPTYTLSVYRPNINYIVRHSQNKLDKMLQVLSAVRGTAIVYTRSRVRTVEVANFLKSAGISAEYYHAGLDSRLKTERQENWKTGKTRVIVATNAFGMGIDKPDVRAVIHLDIPPSLEEYYQEAGRAGRDSHQAFAVLIVGPRDGATMTRRLNASFPPVDFIRRVYELACNFMEIAVGAGFDSIYEFDVVRFCEIFKLDQASTQGAIAILAAAGYWVYDAHEEASSRVMFTETRSELYNSALTQTEEMLLTAMMRRYTGLFADYVYVSEAALGLDIGLMGDDLYPVFLSLSRKHLISYIPKRKIPRIWMLRSRVEPRYIELPDAVYGQRLEIARLRTEAMRRFALSSDKCRTEILSEYFGENRSQPCGVCDVCREKRKS